MAILSLIFKRAWQAQFLRHALVHKTKSVYFFKIYKWYYYHILILLMVLDLEKSLTTFLSRVQSSLTKCAHLNFCQSCLGHSSKTNLNLKQFWPFSQDKTPPQASMNRNSTIWEVWNLIHKAKEVHERPGKEHTSSPAQLAQEGPEKGYFAKVKYTEGRFTMVKSLKEGRFASPEKNTPQRSKCSKKGALPRSSPEKDASLRSSP